VMFRDRCNVAGIPCKLGRAYVRLGKVVVQHQRLSNGKTTLCEADVIRNGAVAGLRRIGGCEAYPSARKARIESDCGDSAAQRWPSVRSKSANR